MLCDKRIIGWIVVEEVYKFFFEAHKNAFQEWNEEQGIY